MGGPLRSVKEAACLDHRTLMGTAQPLTHSGWFLYRVTTRAFVITRLKTYIFNGSNSGFPAPLAQHPLLCISDVFENQINRLFCLNTQQRSSPTPGSLPAFFRSINTLPCQTFPRIQYAIPYVRMLNWGLRGH